MKTLNYLFIIVSLVIATTSCETTNSINKSNGLTLDNFDFQNIVIKGKGEIILSITQNDRDFVEVDATEEQLEFLDVSIDKNKLTITGDRELGEIAQTIYIDLQIRDLKSINIKKGNNAGKIKNNQIFVEFNNEIKGDSLTIHGEGKSEFAGNLQYKYIKLHHEGIVDCELEGSSDYLDMHLEGIAKIDADNLIVKDGNVHSEGISKINVNMLNDANVKAEGIHLIRHNDNPNLKFKREGIVLRTKD